MGQRRSSPTSSVPMLPYGARHFSAARAGSAVNNQAEGNVSETAACVRMLSMIADLLRPPPLPALGHPARNLIVPPVHVELPRHRGSPGRASARHLLRNRQSLGHQIRIGVRAGAAASETASDRSLAHGWKRRNHRGQAVLALPGITDEEYPTQHDLSYYPYAPIVNRQAHKELAAAWQDRERRNSTTTVSDIGSYERDHIDCSSSSPSRLIGAP